VFLLIDNWSALRIEYEGIDQTVAEIAARGLGAGVHLVITAGRWADVRPNLRDSIGSRFELRLNDPTESEVNRRAAAQLPASVPGRGLVNPGVYFQVMLPRVDGRDTDEEVSEAQRETLAAIASAWSGPGAPPVRLLPSRLTMAELTRVGEPSGPGVPLGVAEDDLRPVAINLLGDERHLLILGDAGAGKTTVLRTWLTGLVARSPATDLRVVLLDYRHGLVDLVPPEHLGAYAGDAGTAQVYLEYVVAKLQERIPPSTVTARQLRDRDWWTGPEIYVVVDDYDMVATSMQSVLAPLVPFLPQAREVGLHLVLSRRVAGMARAGMSDQVLTRIKDLGCSGLVMSGDHREGVVFGDERAANRPSGRGVLVRRSHPRQLIQVAIPDAHHPAEPVGAMA
jgi:S-DNA-T family DNA segregation ATPase FtsK/SpoIIIE